MRRASNPKVSSALNEGVVIGKAASRAATQLELTNATFAKILGISEATASRLRAGEYVLEPGSKPFELAALFLRLFRGLDAIVGGDPAAARSWLETENLALRGSPLSLIPTITGLMQTVQYVDARRARV